MFWVGTASNHLSRCSLALPWMLETPLNLKEEASAALKGSFMELASTSSSWRLWEPKTSLAEEQSQEASGRRDNKALPASSSSESMFSQVPLYSALGWSQSAGRGTKWETELGTRAQLMHRPKGWQETINKSVTQTHKLCFGPERQTHWCLPSASRPVSLVHGCVYSTQHSAGTGKNAISIIIDWLPASSLESLK